MNKLRYLLLFLFLVLFLFSCKKSDEEESVLLPGLIVNSICIDHNGTKWIGTNKGLASYNNQTWIKYNNQPSIVSKSIHDIDYQDSEYGDEIWLSTLDGTIVTAYNLDAISSATSYKRSNSDILSDTVYAACLDTGDARWFGTAKGISMFKGSQWYASFKPDYLILNPVTDMCSDAKGRIFVTTNGGGVLRYLYNEVDGISGASIYDKTWSGLGSDNVNSVYVINDTCQWFGTRDGAVYHNTFITQLGWTKYTTNEGLISNNVLSVFVDSSKKVWFGTDAGLSVMENSSWKSYTVADGLLNNVINCIAQDIDGSIWVGTNKGVSHIQDNIWVSYY